MSRSIPLIRAAALGPILFWMHHRRLTWEARLQEAGLPPGLLFAPETPISLIAGARFFTAASRDFGPDLGCRVVTDSSISLLARFGRVLLGARSPRAALHRLARVYPMHSSHERFAVTPAQGGVLLRHRFLVGFDDATLHVCQQYVAALLNSLLAGTGHRGPRLDSVALMPHPEAGLAHLAHWLDTAWMPAERVLTIAVGDAALDAPYLNHARDRSDEASPGPIRGDGTLVYSLKVVLPAMLEQGTPRVEDLAALAGTSRRTLQRRLAAEGLTVSGLIDVVRQEQVLTRLGTVRKAAIAAELGYSAQSSLSRAMRRWGQVGWKSG